MTKWKREYQRWRYRQREDRGSPLRRWWHRNGREVRFILVMAFLIFLVWVAAVLTIGQP